MKKIDGDALWKYLLLKTEEDWIDLMVVWETIQEMPEVADEV